MQEGRNRWFSSVTNTVKYNLLPMGDTLVTELIAEKICIKKIVCVCEGRG